MNKLARKRLCWNCEGSVSLAEETCPFCGVSVVPAFLEGTGANFAPPYSISSEKNFDVPKSPYSLDEDMTSVDSQNTLVKENDDSEPEMDEFKRVIIAVALLLSGSVFFLFGLALALFSHDGIFTLQWNGDIWFIYTLFALPLLLIGWRSVMKLE